MWAVINFFVQLFIIGSAPPLDTIILFKVLALLYRYWTEEGIDTVDMVHTACDY